MLHLRVIAIGQLKERFWRDACSEYLKRLSSYATVNVVELPDVDPARAGGETQAVLREGEAVLQALRSQERGTREYVILLDIGGKEVTSPGIADALENLPFEGVNDVAFIIGGSCGVSEEVRKRADLRWSLGRITLPHNLARVVLLEQLYRAFKIQRREPYHK